MFRVKEGQLTNRSRRMHKICTAGTVSIAGRVAVVVVAITAIDKADILLLRLLYWLADLYVGLRQSVYRPDVVHGVLGRLEQRRRGETVGWRDGCTLVCS